ncbi:MAG TPA: NAD(P)/FAD-dependent oxidoreductase, partial [Polyangiaceae bacterium]|nr:NAD(P)/FAD-dependent oxidoreductase [Polyangiaceae bacterium]
MATLIPPAPPKAYDVIVVGCGPGGSTAAYHLAERGFRVLALERHRFPRYHIGESLTGVAASLLSEMGLVDEMAKRAFPEKTGVKVVGRDAKSEFFVPSLVPTWQVRRDEFDTMLLERAVAAGVDHVHGSVKRILRDGERVVGVAYRASDRPDDLLQEARARMVIDATGHSALMSRHQVAGVRQIDAFGHQIAVFTQFENVLRDEGPMGNNTVIFYAKKHHWAWFIPLSDDVVSVGAVVPTQTYKQIADSPDALMLWATENINPELTRRLTEACAVEPVRTVRNYSYRIEPYAGPGWLCVGDAHRFADPIFSFGVAFAMCEAVAAVKATEQALREHRERQALDAYVAYCDRGHEAAYDLIRYFWRFPAFFPFQVQGEFRHDMMRLFSGDFFRDEEIPALDAMRTSLETFDAADLDDGLARSI